jgi:acetolactate synthase-1/2/3 large subunit
MSRAAAIQLRPDPTAEPTRVADRFVAALAELGVETAFGIGGGAVAPLHDALERSALRVIHMRHETGAAFAAGEASLASGRPSVVFTTTGPGITNAITGLFVARDEGAKVILVSGATPAALRGRGALQESTHGSLLGGVYTAGPLFHAAFVIEHADQLDTVIARLAAGLRRPQGFIAHVAIPTTLQSQPQHAIRRVDAQALRPERVLDPDDVTRCIEHLGDRSFALWVGFGARHAAPQVRALAERLGAPVMMTPRAKGVFPEEHPLCIGVTGLGGDVDARVLADVEHVVVLGSRLREFTCSWQRALVPRGGLVHVDLDRDVPGSAFPDVATLAVHAEIGAFLDEWLRRAAPRRHPRVLPLDARRRHAPLSAVRGAVRPAWLMQMLQRVVVDDTDAVVFADAGNAMAWTIHHLRFDRPGRFRAGLGWASMGHATTGCIGTAIGSGAKPVSVVGDGAMLMSCEISTAVHHGLPCVWIVLNDSQYGMVEHGMRALGYRETQTGIPRTDFAALARAMGADGIRVEREDEIEAALRLAMAAPGPFVVDVVIDPTARPPMGGRLDQLAAQGATGNTRE